MPKAAENRVHEVPVPSPTDSAAQLLETMFSIVDEIAAERDKKGKEASPVSEPDDEGSNF